MMKVAELLSDLVSLQACDHAAAMNLVRGSTTTSSNGQKSPATQQESSPGLKPQLSRSLSGLADEQAGISPDLQRALDLVDLHYGVKERYICQGGSVGLDKARADVERALQNMK